MSPDQEQTLFTSLGRIEQKIDSCVAALVIHTEQDADNFAKLELQMTDIRDRQIKEVENKIAALNLVAAEKKGADEAMAKAASASGGKWGAALGTVVSIIIGAASVYFGK